MDKHLTYTIQQVSEVTGLSKQVIRKWEDRYGIIQPKRLENGYRIYSKNELDLLKKIVSYTNEGYGIKQAAEFAKLDMTNKDELPTQATMQSPNVEDYLNSLIRAGEAGDDTAIMHLLQQVHNLYGVQILLDDVIVPFMKKVGELWCDKVWGEYQEALSSQTIRDFLTNLRRTIYVPENGPLIVGGCLPEERHENPMHILLIKCMLKGYQTKMLGPAPAPSAIESTVQLTNPEIVLLSGSTRAVMKDGGRAIIALDRFASTVPDTKFFIGGYGVNGLKEELKLKFIQETHSLEDILIEG